MNPGLISPSISKLTRFNLLSQTRRSYQSRKRLRNVNRRDEVYHRSNLYPFEDMSPPTCFQRVGPNLDDFGLPIGIHNIDVGVDINGKVAVAIPLDHGHLPGFDRSLYPLPPYSLFDVDLQTTRYLCSAPHRS